MQGCLSSFPCALRSNAWGFPLAGDVFRLLFQRKEVRRTIHNNELWFVNVDEFAALSNSADPQGYVKDMRRRDPDLAKGWGQIATPLSIATVGGPQNLNGANTEGLYGAV
jgi:DNA-damage-inducible protein D